MAKYHLTVTIPMHLKQLKLAGFKSFIDPTVVPFPSQLVGVVGPNGCGKSNIIDAVRWVMGESSAKNLRGESMVDVIFNGSSHRKPLGQASVELIFDNSLGRVVGPFASYGEISVKRVVTRDGESSYFLNGERCRRRDITDIFLGTGAGSRGYSIIGQGTISRLIEAKPEELRAFLEEAAGVSKYKERRRETLQRIEHTRENLTRVADIREELDKQLQRLERQAKAAERYTQLKAEEQVARSRVLAFKWQDLTSQQTFKQKELQALALHHEQHQTALISASTQRIQLNEQLHEANEQTQKIQDLFYQQGTEIVRLEETIAQQAREKRRLEQDRQQLQCDWQIAEERLKQDSEALQNAQINEVTLNEQLQALTFDVKAKESQWQGIQQDHAAWETRWQAMQTQGHAMKSELQVAQVNLQHTEQKQLQTLLRLEKIHQDQQALSLTDLEQIKLNLEATRLALKETQACDESQYKLGNDASHQLRSQLTDTEQQLHQLQDQLQQFKSEHAALMAAQQAARQLDQRGTQSIEAWSDKPRLIDILQVDSEWQDVCDMVLNDALHAYVIDSFDEVWPQWAACERQGESVVTLREVANSKSQYPRLSDKIQGKVPATVHALETIYTAADLNDAMRCLSHLLDHESVVTQQGVWLGRGWVKLTNPAEVDELGLLVRSQKIIDLSVLLEDLQEKTQSLRTMRDQCHSQWQHSLQHAEQLQLTLNASNEALRTNASAQVANEQAYAQTQERLSSLALEAEGLKEALEEVVSEAITWREREAQLALQSQDDDKQQVQFTEEKQRWLTTRVTAQQEMDDLRALLHQAELKNDRERTQIQQLTDRMNRETEHMHLLQERLEGLASLDLTTDDPESNLQSQLEMQLLKHREVEGQLTSSREKISEWRMRIEALETQITAHELDVKRVEESISQTRLQEQALAVRAASVQESLDEMGLQAMTVLDQVALGITLHHIEEDLIALGEKIKRLGAINLAAIEEFAADNQRKIYLDEQYNDLNQALTTLEAAIEKMDNETRQRLENTFDEVNTSFKALFPRLFGGGRAQLELTCDNLLEAGIVVMAQPPGKRNSSIHLLSGGEKAMTAVALVFAIFQLNPSPFCMLDEVDAPLDDVNVGRFCDLVKEMSQLVQFLFITHNKVTMELADHLIGVTMREPGVSRLVTVDVKQALTLE